jgi:23S rRNA (uracil1939-C5)-methyltransferase
LPDGKTVLVSGGCPGDLVEIEVLEDKPRFARARVVEIVEPSPDRVAPPCPYFGVCGGCQWQHVSYEAQLSAKRDAVVDALTRIGRIQDADKLVAEVAASEAQYGYRNKVELVPDPESSRLTLGYHRAASHDVVGVDECLLLPKRLLKAPKSLTGALRYLSGANDLQISRVELRVAANTSDVELAIWTPPGGFPRAAAARTLGQALPLTSMVRVLHKGPVKERNVSKVEVLSGRGCWTERVAGTSFAVSAPSFFQVNTAVAELMTEALLGELETDGSDVALDVYAGAGTFTLPIARSAGETIAIESYGSAVRDLRRNLEQNALHADVVGGDAEREMAGIGHFDVAVVDPPRSGLSPAVIDAIAAGHPRVLAYVSCDPATLARDAERLRAAGLDLVSAKPFDLFPQSYHVETIATFRPA